MYVTHVTQRQNRAGRSSDFLALILCALPYRKLCLSLWKF
nr:MAG TPA: hypothetical protein [Caudoviricetes sp.]